MADGTFTSSTEVAQGLAEEWARGVAGFEGASIAFSGSGGVAP